MSQDKSVSIIGAGIAGLAVAIRLKKLGFNVHVFEKSSTHGGKLTELKTDSFRWDKGPSLFTLPHLVDELFELCDKNPRDYFSYSKLSHHCSYYFHDDFRIDFIADSTLLKKQLAEKFNVEIANDVIDYFNQSKKTYEGIGQFFIDNPSLKWYDFLTPKLIKRYPQFLTKKLRLSLNDYNKSKLKHDKLIQLFNRYGTYNGSNPYQMSGLYSMVPHLEQNVGTYFPNEGMRSIVDSLFKLAQEEGVTFNFNSSILSIQPEKNGYKLNLLNDAEMKTDIVVSAIDHLNFYKNILKDNQLFEYYRQQERSTSGLILYLGLRRTIDELNVHNIFFSKDYLKEFNQLFKVKKIPDDPTFYVHVSSKHVKSDAINGGQNLFVMINTPAGIEVTNDDIENCKAKFIQRIQKHFHVDITNEIIVDENWTTQGIEQDTGSWQGALYGASSNNKMAALKRHGNKQKKYPNIYFCGGTVHPGGGIPLVLKSSKIVADLIQNEVK